MDKPPTDGTDLLHSVDLDNVCTLLFFVDIGHVIRVFISHALHILFQCRWKQFRLSQMRAVQCFVQWRSLRASRVSSPSFANKRSSSSCSSEVHSPPTLVDQWYQVLDEAKDSRRTLTMDVALVALLHQGLPATVRPRAWAYLIRCESVSTLQTKLGLTLFQLRLTPLFQ